MDEALQPTLVLSGDQLHAYHETYGLHGRAQRAALRGEIDSLVYFVLVVAASIGCFAVVWWLMGWILSLG